MLESVCLPDARIFIANFVPFSTLLLSYTLVPRTRPYATVDTVSTFTTFTLLDRSLAPFLPPHIFFLYVTCPDSTT